MSSFALDAPLLSASDEAIVLDLLHVIRTTVHNTAEEQALFLDAVVKSLLNFSPFVASFARTPAVGQVAFFLRTRLRANDRELDQSPSSAHSELQEFINEILEHRRLFRRAQADLELARKIEDRRADTADDAISIPSSDESEPERDIVMNTHGICAPSPSPVVGGVEPDRVYSVAVPAVDPRQPALQARYLGGGGRNGVPKHRRSWTPTVPRADRQARPNLGHSRPRPPFVRGSATNSVPSRGQFRTPRGFTPSRPFVDKRPSPFCSYGEDVHKLHRRLDVVESILDQLRCPPQYSTQRRQSRRPIPCKEAL
ncbi:hypothetical protein FB45DRAFT_999162 [Roridomyces roridus]|uniref:Uncharacterized protein n=1 Tax=Roridomyces roridus TaxID=1738132 RepID=A0AAD7CAX4_9AGAR|nr:hypothetical protein FB45DRAFT_999162 [Roridomyces roridus]